MLNTSQSMCICISSISLCTFWREFPTMCMSPQKACTPSIHCSWLKVWCMDQQTNSWIARCASFILHAVFCCFVRTTWHTDFQECVVRLCNCAHKRMLCCCMNVLFEWQGRNMEYDGLPVSEALSMGVHESQVSASWNIVSFCWIHLYNSPSVQWWTSRPLVFILVWIKNQSGVDLKYSVPTFLLTHSALGRSNDYMESFRFLVEARFVHNCGRSLWMILIKPRFMYRAVRYAYEVKQ